MKKILLGTTLLSAVGLFAGAAQAEGPKVTLGGFADFQIGVVNEDLDTNTRAHAFRSDTEVTVRVDGKTEGGLGYGGGIDLEADTGQTGSGSTLSSDSDNQGLNASRTFVYVDGSWGRVEMGSEVGAQGTMKVDASNIARATGGIDGDFTYYMTAPSGNFWVTPDLDLGYGAGALGNESQENLNKVTYYTPRFAGFQVGVSYMVNNGSTGLTTSNQENIWAGGVSYEGKFDQVSIAAAVTGERGSAEVGAREDLRAWNAGAKLGYMGFSVAGSYGNISPVGSLNSSNVDDTKYWTLGGAYETGPFGASVTYLNSERGVTSSTSNDFDNISVGVDYKLAPGFTPYAEVSFFDADLTGSTVDNKGTVFIAGTQLNF
jgi:hypothetical protein